MNEGPLEITRWCGTMPMHHRLLDAQPGYAEARTGIENEAFAWRRPRREAPVTIPVVVHVVWHQEADNVADEQIHSQIEVLNADFRMRGAGVDTVPEPFQALVADARLEFALADTGPDGAPTTGITRTRTDTAVFDADDTVKHAASGGADAWPADRYLNIWVCPLGGGLLGYAQFPGGAPETDGVVVNHRGFGTTGTATAPFDGGRTTVHEIGHWLNLRHIWGDDGEGCSGDDFVADTPNQGGPNRGRPEFPNISCDNAPHGDLFMNFMDYSDDAVTVMFTQGQTERMDACLAGPRGSFLAAPDEPVEPDDAEPVAA
ncbi:zinc metalloprotease [Glycomyces tenuis]|uniref:zinc metalloprotease n=1 Tax=Glycomyces tenuis TaxID=58116 RepID=UPI000426CF6D|nr:zinc metalloprotease [Glycomyces tenuis]